MRCLKDLKISVNSLIYVTTFYKLLTGWTSTGHVNENVKCTYITLIVV